MKKKNRQIARRIEPSRAQSLFDTQKSLSERYLITFCFSRNFWSEKLFAESFGTREARKIEPWYELSFQNVYWALFWWEIQAPSHKFQKVKSEKFAEILGKVSE